MKILQIIPKLGAGGAERFVCELANELVTEGMDCSIATLFDLQHSDNVVKSQLNNNIQLMSLHKKLGLDIRLFWKVFRLIKNEKFDVVHAHIGAIKYILLASLFLRKVRFVATIHSEASREAGNKFERFVRKIMFKYGWCKAVTISEESNASFKIFYSLDAIMIYNGVSDYANDSNVTLKSSDDEIIFIHAASCQPVKNQELLFQSFSKLVKDFGNVKLIWFGSNDAYKDLFNNLTVYFTEKIVYGGLINNVRDYLVKADAFCLSSKMEGMPISIIEAFSVGCIPLCTPVGGIKNMIQSGENGMLSEDLSVDAYYKMLKNFVLLDKNQREQMKYRAIASFEKYKITTVAKKYMDLYKG